MQRREFRLYTTRLPDTSGRAAWARWSAVLLLGSCVLFLGACTHEAPPAAGAPPSLSVKVMRVEPRPLEDRIDVTGTLVSSVAVDVKTEFPGRIVTMAKQEGDHVDQDELLAQLDEANAGLAVEQARANLEVAEAALGRSKVAEEHARLEEQRARNLISSAGITDRDFQAAQMAARDARAQIRLAEAQIEQGRQALAIAEKRLADCRMVSPIAGEVERKYLNPGSYADGGALLYRLVDNRRLEVETYVPSAELARLRLGQRLRFSVSAYPAEEFEARILIISPAVQSQNRSLPVRAAVPNPSGKLKAGMYVRGRIVAGTKPDAIVVPTNAVWRRPNQPPFVYVVEQNRARMREVRPGLEQPGGIEIAQGLKGGDVVVTEQYLELADGATVSPLS